MDPSPTRRLRELAYPLVCWDSSTWQIHRKVHGFSENHLSPMGSYTSQVVTIKNISYNLYILFNYSMLVYIIHLPPRQMLWQAITQSLFFSFFNHMPLLITLPADVLLPSVGVSPVGGNTRDGFFIGSRFCVCSEPKSGEGAKKKCNPQCCY